MKTLDGVIGAASVIAAIAWSAYGFGWIQTEPTSRTADIMAILWTFQAQHFIRNAYFGR